MKSHIIPRAFYARVQRDADHLKIVSDTARFAKRSRIGVYDPKLLCAACESRMGRFDNEGINILLRRYDAMAEPVPGMPIEVVKQVRGIDVAKLKRFLLSVLWRAHASSLPDFANVDLGAGGDALRDHLMTDEPDWVDAYGALLIRFAGPPIFGLFQDGLMLSPVREQYDGFDCYRIYLPPFTTILCAETAHPRILIPSHGGLRTGSEMLVLQQMAIGENQLKQVRKLIDGVTPQHR